MKILVGECLPAALEGTLTALGHECETVRRAGYGSKKNGELLSLAEGRWDVLLTSDRNIKYQQNMTGRNVSILILCTKSNRMKDLLPFMPLCAEALLSIKAGRWSRSGPFSQMIEQTKPIAASYYRARYYEPAAEWQPSSDPAHKT
jgi:predicted nuclease of predicted toxin-antitoxin system